MSDPNRPDSPEANNENEESFGELLSEYEHTHARKPEGGQQLQGTVIAVSADSVFLDIGFKTEGIMPLAIFQGKGQTVTPGDKLFVTVKGRGPEGYYEVALGRVNRPKDWSTLEKAFADKATIVGTVTGVIKGGLSVDVGVRAFMPASRSGAREASEMEKLVGQEIRCRITKLDATEEDVVVDRRGVLEEEANAAKERRYSELREGDVVNGEVRSLADYGAFVDLGGVDGLLHVSDISWSRVNKPEDVLSVGQQVEAKVLKITTEGTKRRIALGMKQLQPEPWDTVPEKFTTGDRIRGTVTRVADFGAFVELEPGVEGLIHVSEMSWAKRVKKASDLLKPGDTVETIILGVNSAERRISLGLKQTLGDPWADVAQKFPVGSVIQGPVTNLTNFGAFVQLTEGVEGMVHVGDISAEKRINHPQDVLKVGQVVKAQVLGVDVEKRRIALGMKQLAPTSLDEYIAEHKAGDVVTGRILEVSGDQARVELGEGIHGTCGVTAKAAEKKASTAEASTGKPDLSSLSSMLEARWKGGSTSQSGPETVKAGEIRSVRILKLDQEAKKIDLELA